MCRDSYVNDCRAHIWIEGVRKENMHVEARLATFETLAWTFSTNTINH